LQVTAVIFDLDGTLIDSEGDLLRAANRMLGEIGRAPLSAPEFQSMIGDAVGALVARVLAARHCTSVDPTNAARRFLEHYSVEPTTLTRAYPGTQKLLESLQARGKKLAVCTNKPTRFVRPILERLSLDRYFECVLGGDSLPFRKPDPRVVLEALKALETPASSALFVGSNGECHPLSGSSRLPPGLGMARAARADAVSEAIVITHGPRGRISPPVLARGLLRITRIKDAILRLARFADDEQTHFARAVVQEAVTDTRAGGKSGRIARTQPMQLAIEPDIRCTRDHIHELLLSAFGVRI
jgi:phosphoglycolate phosphatase